MTAGRSTRRKRRTWFPYDTRAIKRVDALFQNTTYVRTATLLLVCAALLRVHYMPMLLVLVALHIGGIVWQAVLVRQLPLQIGPWGLAVVAASTLVVGAPFMLGTLYLWGHPDTVVRFAGVFALCLAMIDTVCARRGDPVLFICDNLWIALVCLMFPVVSVMTGRSTEEAVLIGFVAMISFGFYVFGATEVMQTREALDAAQQDHADRAKTEALGRLTGGVAHDFNNLLTVISGNLELARHAPGRCERDALLDDAATAAAKAAQVTGRLLAYSRRATLHPGPVDLVESLSELAMLLTRLLPAGIRFGTAVCPDLPLLVADKGQFDMVLMNLAINARDALHGNGRICARVMRERVTLPVYVTSSQAVLPKGDYIRIEIEDNGSGMTDDVAARVFEPYFTTKEMGRGTGMGLAMARGFAEQSGGLLMLKSAPGVGTIATLLLPAYRPDGIGVAPDVV